MPEQDVVSKVALFPIKGFHEATVDGEVPAVLDVSPTGFEAYGTRDREFIVVEEEAAVRGLFLSQRGWGANGKTVHRSDTKLATYAVDVRPDHLTVTAPRVGHFELATAYDQAAEPLPTTVHGQELAARDQGDEAADFLSRAIGRAVRLVRASRELPRMLPLQHQRFGASNMVAGADGVPFLLTSQASLDWLLDNQVLRRQEELLNPDEIPLANYRANIEIEGSAIGAFGEDEITMASFGDMVAYVVKACGRCPVPNNDQETGVPSNASSRLMRRRAGADEYGRDGVYMGQNLNHIYQADLRVRVGDAVSLLGKAMAPNVTLRPANP